MNTIKCPQCNLTNWASSNCKRCGFIFDRDPPPVEHNTQPANEETAYVRPAFEDRQYSTSRSIAANGEPKTGLALASMILGIVGFALCFITSPVGLILGIVALIKASRRPSEYGGQGFAIAGVVLGAMATLFIPIIAAIAIPNLLAARRAANEGSAISALRTLRSAEETYIATQGAGNCGELRQLGASGLIDSVLASGRRSGYRFEVVLAANKQTCDVHATPETASTGTRSFLISDDGVIRAANKHGAKADKLDPALSNPMTKYQDYR